MTALGWVPLAVFAATVVASTGVGLAQSDHRPPWERDRSNLPLVGAIPLSITDVADCAGDVIIDGNLDFVYPLPRVSDAPQFVAWELEIPEESARRLTYTWRDESRGLGTYIV